ncbi:MAG: hypothetical protein H0V17_11490 [Deltaproteobacteria bacterium]|nr:hypothetical protein [Deltaproteobacteria bacterium]
MRVIAMLTCLALCACFPNNPKHRTYAKLVEGGFVAGGIGLLAFSSTQADCDMDIGLGMPRMDCKSRAGLISGIGLTMILLGMVGFAATVTTAVDDPTPAPGTTTNTPATPPAPPSTSPTPIAE